MMRPFLQSISGLTGEPASITPIYSEYRYWKGPAGEQFAQISPAMARTYRAELSRAGAEITPGMKVLEIGFGNGEFLAYARMFGADVSGAELDPEAVALARTHGFNAEVSADLAQFAEHSFDLVVAIDVLEHVPMRRLPAMLLDIKRILKPGGTLLARFPNGDSPFGLANQNGCTTHFNAIGTEKARYYAANLGASIIVLAGEARPIPAGNWKHTIQRIISWPVKKAVNLAVKLFFIPGYKGDFCSPNLVLALRMPDCDPSAV